MHVRDFLLHFLLFSRNYIRIINRNIYECESYFYN
jgi:hypothetical protein